MTIDISGGLIGTGWEQLQAATNAHSIKANPAQETNLILFTHHLVVNLNCGDHLAVDPQVSKTAETWGTEHD